MLVLFWLVHSVLLPSIPPTEVGPTGLGTVVGMVVVGGILEGLVLREGNWTGDGTGTESGLSVSDPDGDPWARLPFSS